ncbi:hypothetical protein [Methanoplanus endosymbiosus]|uniref:Uncharacterized protein n=1 Tax=Methanoplanus endosymbiosus TaxID=33865 RepID=A0A9E7PKJ7_9EURY|nr:hypothetical protein [Methanoplanus endosymbiosus]UUX91758.1 hypothetical protein L6E24_10340 [Methanoplanus endosymbiosus]
MEFKRFFLLGLVLFAFIIIPGCSEEDECGPLISDIDRLEKSADERLKTLDLSDAGDGITVAQTDASKEQYYEALTIIFSIRDMECMDVFIYNNRLRYLQLKYDTLDVYQSVNGLEERTEVIFASGPSEFKIETADILTGAEILDRRAEYLGYMADEINQKALSKESQDIITKIKTDLEIQQSRLRQISGLLLPYR